MTAEAESMSDERVKSLYESLYASAKRHPKRRFGILMDKVLRWDVLWEAWKRVRANGGTCGVDHQSIQDVEAAGVLPFLQDLKDEVEAGRYTAGLIRRVRIPKGDGRTRPLGIPVVRDRVLQMAVKLVLEPLFDCCFCECSYGYRPGRSVQQAAQRVHELSNRRKWIVDMDLSSYFDTIPHEPLMDLVRRRVSDKRVLHLIVSWLRAGVLEKGSITCPIEGSPQGGVLSPLLSNIYLHEFDRTWDTACGELVRYADDMVILCFSEWEAQRALAMARQRLETLGLTLNREKTRLVHIAEGFEFLGFRYMEAYSPRCKRLVRIKIPRPKAMKKIRASIKERLKKQTLGLPLREVIADVNRALRGWAQYFRIGNSYAAALSLSRYACDQLRLYWRRSRPRRRGSCTRVWPNSFFYDLGLHYVPSLLRRTTNAVV